jgi:hypothetical protein
VQRKKIEMKTASIRLAADELADLVGSSHKKRQIEWLGHRGWRFDLDVNGRPIVLREFVQQRLGVRIVEAASESPRPRFELIAS